MKRQILITYDPATVNNGGPDEDDQPFDLYGYLCNELDNHRMLCDLQEFDSACVLVTGNPFAGIRVHGPFRNIEQAQEAAEGVKDNWWVVNLTELDA